MAVQARGERRVKPYPWYYAVNDRPVKIVLTPDGGADCLVFDFATGGFIPDRSYFSQVLPGSGKDVDQLTEADFEHLTASLRTSFSVRRREAPILWEFSCDSGPGYRGEYLGRTYTARINPPGHPPYTLFVDGQPVEDLDEWPAAWVMASTRDEEADESQPAGPSIRASLLRKWSEQICLAASGGRKEIAAALAIDGSVVERGNTGTVESPPEGTTRLRLVEHPAGFSYIEVSVAGGALTRSQLDAHFGVGRDVPRVHPDSAYTVAYRVEVPGAPFTCAVFCAFRRPPTPEASAHEVVLRRDGG